MSEIPSLRCAEAKPYLAAFADGELVEPMRAQIEAHTARCRACQQQVLRYQTIDALIAALPHSAPAPEVLDKIISATSSKSAEPAVRESLCKPHRQLVSRALPAFLTLPEAEPAPQPTRRHAKHSLWLTGALPTLAALLIITMALVAFHRLPLSDRLSSKGQHQNISHLSTLEQTRQQVTTQQKELSFTPMLPTYLPPGTQLQSVAVGPAHVGITSHFLDVYWAVPHGIGTIHLRESPIRLSIRKDISVGSVDPTLSWQIGAQPWRPVALQSAHNHWAVGQDRDTFSISLDVDQRGSNGAITSTIGFQKVNALRLISLSLETPYAPITVATSDQSGYILHYQSQAATAQGNITWDGWMDATHNRLKITAKRDGQLLYTDVLVAGHGASPILHIDAMRHTYTHLSLDSAGYAYLASQGGSISQSLPPDVSHFFYEASTFISDGEWWNLGSASFANVSAYKLAIDNAPHSTYVYIDQKTSAIVGMQMDTASTMQPGGPLAKSVFVSKSICQSPVTYTLVEYLKSAPAEHFAASAPPNYQESAAVPTAVCG